MSENNTNINNNSSSGSSMGPPPPVIKEPATSTTHTAIRSESAPNFRSKVPLGSGYGLTSWYRLAETGELERMIRKKLPPGTPPVRAIPMSEVRQHRTESDCWIVLRGKVYDVTVYLDYHPGGAAKLMMAAGKDATSLFDKYHAWVNADHLLAKCFLGYLAAEDATPGAALREQKKEKLDQLREKYLGLSKSSNGNNNNNKSSSSS